jgi:DNA-directed RNA polymerase III subunit RPC6
MVYALIDESGAEGIWSKTIKTRSNLHDTTMRAAIKALETKRYITDMKSVEHLNRKMYIKASLTPSEKATGGPWYTDGELDEEFIDMIGNVLYNYIFAKSFYKSSNTSAARKPKKTKTGTDKAIASASKGKGRPSTEEAKALRASALDPKIKIEDEEERAAKKRKQDLGNFLPLPAGYQGYPTLDELTLFVDNAKFSTTTLTKDDIAQLLDVLCFDKRIEKVVCGAGGLAYKALRKSAQEMEDGPSNGLTEAPCGRCPVFDLCEEGGPVGPSTCEYFREWLSA